MACSQSLIVTGTYQKESIRRQRRKCSYVSRLHPDAGNGWVSSCGTFLRLAKSTGQLSRMFIWGSFVTNSTVVIWSGHIGSYEDHAPLLGKYLRKDLVNRGTLG